MPEPDSGIDGISRWGYMILSGQILGYFWDDQTPANPRFCGGWAYQNSVPLNILFYRMPRISQRRWESRNEQTTW